MSAISHDYPTPTGDPLSWYRQPGPQGFTFTDRHGNPLIRECRDYDQSGSKNGVPLQILKDGSWQWSNRGDPLPCRPLYNLSTLHATEPGSVVYVIEGPPKVELLRYWGLTATCNLMGSNSWLTTDRADRELLARFRVVIVPDNDEQSERWVQAAGRDLLALQKSFRPNSGIATYSVHVLRLPGLDHKEDLMDWAKLGHTREDFLKLQPVAWEEKSPEKITRKKAPPTGNPNLDYVVERLEDLGFDVEQSGQAKYRFQCPVHDDRKPSGSLTAGDRRPVLVNCHHCKGLDQFFDTENYSKAFCEALGLPHGVLSEPWDSLLEQPGMREVLGLPPAAQEAQAPEPEGADEERKPGERPKEVTLADLNKKRQTGQAKASPGGLVVQRLEEVKMQPVEWLVPDLIPAGKLTLLSGDGGLGKSTLTLDLAACLTTGRPAWGLDYEVGQPADVLLISCEDDAGDTILPRFLAAGGDRKRASLVTGRRDDKGNLLAFTLQEVQCLVDHLEAHPEIRLVVIDPVSSFMGGKVDEYKESDVRRVLDPLIKLAARTGVAFVLVKHHSKANGGKATHKVSGSIAYVNLCRQALAVAADSESEELRLLMPTKRNLTKDSRALAYHLIPLTDDEAIKALEGTTDHLTEARRAALRESLFRVAWEGKVDVNPDQVLNATPNPEAGNRVTRCVQWLRQGLQSGLAWPDAEVLEAAKAAGFTLDTYKLAKKALRDEGLTSKPDGLGGPWWIGLNLARPADWIRRHPGQAFTAPEQDDNLADLDEGEKALLKLTPGQPLPSKPRAKKT